MPIKEKVYTLDDGSEWTILELMEKTGFGKSTIYHRVGRLKITDPELVFQKPNNANVLIDKALVEWKDDPVEVYGGIPMNPYYMDGMQRKGNDGVTCVVDRYGNILSQAQRNALMRYRDAQRDDWRNERKNYITGDK